MSKISSIQINFPVPVDLSDADAKALVEVATRICDRYEADHPHRTMWPFGIGSRPTFIPMTPDEEARRGIEFDESVFQIDCNERENYDCRCARCGKPQGDHGHCIVDPPAGECVFSHTQ